MKQQKIVIFLFLILMLSVGFAPLVRGDEANGLEWWYDYANGNSYTNLAHVHPSSNGYVSGSAQTFLASFTGYLDFITVDLAAINNTAGYTSVTVVCKIYNVDVQSYSGEPTGAALETTANQTITGGTGTYLIYEFDFAHTTHLISGTYYAFSIEVIAHSHPDDANHYLRLLRGTTSTSGESQYHSSNWWNAANRVCGYISAIPDADMPTATPSPTPYLYQGDIWAALSPYANILLPLVLIVFIALLCGKYGGVWGFFAGLNVTAILVYAIMGAAYMPLWGLLMLALVDGLLLFGKISGRM